ncbi:hypothetical protein BJ875DRAFT_462349 [Amylocarpus encephaloides]|uniref:Uncharacterized protein n=1 Tax=Amylocarpus encephaloides TaxID=45428 RepID=A0A9P8C4Z6_9HELO|nr:hypothetical protein BJ875DRAFT_462349 [Amylocarpus encephaloides]
MSMRELYKMAEEAMPSILIVFLPEVAEIVNLRPLEKLSALFKIPDVFWSSVAHDSSGYFGCQDTRDHVGELQSFNSHFRFLIKEPVTPKPFAPEHSNAAYKWHKFGYFTSWTPLKKLVVLCFGLPECLQKSITGLEHFSVEDPFWFHTTTIQSVITLYDKNLWAWRDLVRALELNRASADDPRPDYIKIHELARHTIHCTETLGMAIETMTSLTGEHQIFFDENESLPKEIITKSKQTRRSLRSQMVLLKSLHLRSKALEERLRNETTLAFNIVAQHDSRVAVGINEAAKTDSAAMKTISILGLIFLPGTFICAIFSTSFFNFSPASDGKPQKWTVSDKFWIYWVVSIPVTFLTVLFWILWQRLYERLPFSHRRRV